jgi:hypothetical protein
MSFLQAFATNLALNLVGGSGKSGARGQAAPVQQVQKLNLGGYKRAVGRRGSQASKSRAAPVTMASTAGADSIYKTVIARMLRETKDKVKQAKVMKA